MNGKKIWNAGATFPFPLRTFYTKDIVRKPASPAVDAGASNPPLTGHNIGRHNINIDFKPHV